MAAFANIKVSGGKAWKRAIAPYLEHENPGVNVGVLPGATYNTGPLAGELVAPNLAKHEFGDEHTPARSPFRSTLERKKGEWVRAMVGILKANPGKIEMALNAVGMQAAKDIQQSFEDGLEPQLKPETVKRKQEMGYAAHADKPVMLTGEAQKSIEHEYVTDLRSKK